MSTPLGPRDRVGTVILAAAATAVGLGIAVVDSRPGWDDTGITAVSLFVAAGLAAAVAGRWPWLWALLVGAWVPLLESGRDGNPASLAALAFAAAGAGLGWAVRRGRRSVP